MARSVVADPRRAQDPRTRLGRVCDPSPRFRAALLNGTLIRYLDFNDSYQAPGETCHRSRNLGAILAATDYGHPLGPRSPRHPGRRLPGPVPLVADRPGAAPGIRPVAADVAGYLSKRGGVIGHRWRLAAPVTERKCWP